MDNINTTDQDKVDEVTEIAELKRRKKLLKLTTANLAYLADIPVSTVSKIMTGETKHPQFATIEKIDLALSKEERRKRLEAYLSAMKIFFAEHPDLEYDQREFEKLYRQKHRLSSDPIPFAVPMDELTNIEGNLASWKSKRSQNKTALQLLHELGENRNLEMIDGRIIYSEMPGIAHQTLVQQIGSAIHTFIMERGGSCLEFHVGVNVQLDEDEDTLVIPDIVVLCDRSKLHEQAIIGPPDLVMEVVSPSTKKTDYHDKLHKYMGSGVQEYWIIDIDRQLIAVYRQGEPMLTALYSFDDEVPVGIYGNSLRLCMNSMQ